jgi:(1->4)-alpha-D-glucan 1-alpha-D-glucosylmutase
MQRRHQQHPGALNAGTTHDTKRSEDVRARLLVLSEMAGAWVRAVERWREENADRRRVVHGRPAPDGGEELLVYQTLAGVWPLDERDLAELPERLAGYLRKALREAKEHSSWLAPDEAYEAAVIDFACGLASEGPDGPFMRSFLPIQGRVALAGAVNSLAAALLRLTAPGIPDIYQGSELWNLSLSDPDNRRPVDFALRRRLLGNVERGERGGLCEELAREWRDGRIQLLLTASALRLRREQPALVTEGAYLPLRPAGPEARNVVAYARRHHERWLLASAPRLSAALTLHGRMPLGEDWGGAGLRLPKDAPAVWRDAVSGAELRADAGSLRLADVFRHLPVGLLLPV